MVRNSGDRPTSAGGVGPIKSWQAYTVKDSRIIQIDELSSAQGNRILSNSDNSIDSLHAI